MRSIKVVHLANFDLGLQVHARNMIRYLRDQGYRTYAVTHPGTLIRQDTVTADGIPVKVIPFPSRITPLRDLKTLLQLYRYFRAERFDIVHAHTIKPGLLGRIAARLAGVPVVLYTIHGFHFHDEMHPREVSFYGMIERVGALFSDLLLSQNREDIQTAIRMKIARPEELRYLGNGIDTRVFHPSRVTPELVGAKRRELGIPPGSKVVAMVGRLVREKGFYEYFEAARILKEQGFPAVFLAAGATHCKKGAVDPMRLLGEHGLDGYLRFLGLRHDIPDLMSAIDLLVSPSYAEGIPRNVMEACALGKPVVATDVRGTREIVEDGVNGLLVPAKDPTRLAHAIRTVLSDDAQADAMGRAGRAKAEQMMDERAFFVRTDRAYRELLRRKRPQVDWEALIKPVPTTWVESPA
ncbi:MAG: glycosyltransferase family 4 protein [bacterium]